MQDSKKDTDAYSGLLKEGKKRKKKKLSGKLCYVNFFLLQLMLPSVKLAASGAVFLDCFIRRKITGFSLLLSWNQNPPPDAPHWYLSHSI